MRVITMNGVIELENYEVLNEKLVSSREGEDRTHLSNGVYSTRKFCAAHDEITIRLKNGKKVELNRTIKSWQDSNKVYMDKIESRCYLDEDDEYVDELEEALK